MRNLIEIFMEDVPYGNIEIHKKRGFTLCLKNAFLEKQIGDHFE